MIFWGIYLHTCFTIIKLGLEKVSYGLLVGHLSPVVCSYYMLMLTTAQTSSPSVFASSPANLVSQLPIS